MTFVIVQNPVRVAKAVRSLRNSLTATVVILALPVSAPMLRAQVEEYPLWDTTVAAPWYPLEAIHGTEDLHVQWETPSGIRTTPEQCMTAFQMDSIRARFTYYFDATDQVSELFVFGGILDPIKHYKIDASMKRTEVPLPLPDGLPPWIAKDLDLDGNLELVTQDGDGFIGGTGYLQILSAPDWHLRASFAFPGMQVSMYPIAVNIDDDPYWELYLVPRGFGFAARAVLVDYNPVTQNFEKIADIEAPAETGGMSAAGDFDGDGRMEFVSGNAWGYGVFEYDGDTLSFAGWAVRDSVVGANWSAVTVQPKPDGRLYVLLSHSPGWNNLGYSKRYQLLIAVSDNAFEVVHEWQEYTGSFGGGFCYGSDLDCDGLDELVLQFYPLPLEQVIEWDEEMGDFVSVCGLGDSVFFTQYERTDFDQDGAPELTALEYDGVLYSYEDARCPSCYRVKDGLLAWWPLDITSNKSTPDIWGGLSGTALGTPLPYGGHVSGAIEFDGLDDAVRVPHAAIFTGMREFALEMWVYVTDFAPRQPLITDLEAAGDGGWSMWLEDGIRLAFAQESDPSTAYISEDCVELADGEWHHLTVNVDRLADEITFYVDGIEQTGRGIRVDDALVPTTPELQGLWLGACPDIAGDTTFSRVAIDEVSLWRQALQPAQIGAIAAAQGRGKCKNAVSGCDCTEQGNVTGDEKIIDVLDVATLVDHVFRGSSSVIADPHCPHINRGDVNCDGIDNVLDVVTLVNISFRGENPRVICNPCGCDPYPTNCR